MRTKITFILLLSALICGQTMYAEDNIFGTIYDNKDIFALYDKAYDNAAEITEYRGERLFEILQSDSVDLFLGKLSIQKPSIRKKIIDACCNPPYAEVDVWHCIINVYETRYLILKKQILQNLEVALDRSNALRIEKFPAISIDSVFIHNLAQTLSVYVQSNSDEHFLLDFKPNANESSDTTCMITVFKSFPPRNNERFIGFTELNNVYFWFPRNTPQDLLITKIESLVTGDLPYLLNFQMIDLLYDIKTKKIERKRVRIL